MKDVQRSMFVGAHLPKELPYMDSAKTKWTPVAKGGKFSVTFDSEGIELFKLSLRYRIHIYIFFS